MTFIRWSLIDFCLEYVVDNPTLFPDRRKKNLNFVRRKYLYMLTLSIPFFFIVKCLLFMIQIPIYFFRNRWISESVPRELRLSLEKRNTNINFNKNQESNVIFILIIDSYTRKRMDFALSAMAVEYTDCNSTEGNPTNEGHGYDTKQSISEASVILENWGMWSPHSLSSLE